MDELTEAVNLALDKVKADQGLTSDYQLATHLGINRMQITRWRGGKLSKAFRIIIPRTVLVNTPLHSGDTDLALDIRILAPLLAIPKIDT